MAKQKRLNKNLIAFLTIMGMLLTVSVAGLVIYQVAQRDPEKIAASAKTLEASGKLADLPEALRLYMQAYRASGERETKYLVDVARCSFTLGGFGDWLTTLRQYMAKEPANPEPLIALLDGLWRLREIDPTENFPADGRDAAIRLLDLHLAGTAKLDPSVEVLALTSRAQCLWYLEEKVGVDQADGLQTVLIDPAQIERFVQAYGHTGDEAAEKAWTIDPTDPHAALTQVVRLRRAAETRESALLKAGEGRQRIRENTRAFHEDALAALQPAVQANPAHVALVVAYAMSLADRARDALVPAEGQIDREAAQPHLTLARATLEAALKGNENEAQFHLALARQCVTEAMTQAPDEANITPEQRAAQEKLLQDAAASAAQATQLEPALYDAYLLHASLLLTPTGSESADTGNGLARIDAALKVYEGAQKDTILLKGVRAVLTEGQRLLLLSRAFTLALQACDVARQTGHPDKVPAYLEQATKFLEDAEVSWGNHVITDYMRGNMAQARSNPQEAIKCLERAAKQEWDAVRWMRMVRVPQLPEHQLAILYARDNQLGAAKEWADDALGQYQGKLQEPPPADLVLLRAQIYTQELDVKDGAQKAKDLLAHYEASFVTQAERDRLAGLRAELFRALGQTAQATEQVRKLVGNNQNDPTLLLWEAEQAQQNEDYDLIDRNTTAVIQDPKANPQQRQLAVQMQMNALQRSDRTDEAQARIAALLEKPPTPEIVPYLKVWKALLSTKDPKEQTALLEQQIEAEPDPQVRSRRLIAFYRGMGRYEDVARLLEAQKRSAPDDLAVIEQLFDAYVRLQRYGEAEALIPLLGDADGGKGTDGVHGATYRGRLALVRNNGAAAVREYRTAVNELPRSAQLQTALARAYLLNGRLTEAEEALRQAVAINWRSPDALGMLTSVRLTLADQDFTRADEWRQLGREVFADLKRVAPNHPAVALLEARFSEEDNPAGAIKTRQTRRKTDPNDLDNTIRLAELYGRIWDLTVGKNLGDEGFLTEAQRTQLRDEGATYFEALLEQPTPRLQALYSDPQSSLFLELAQLATTFFHKSGQRERGEELLTRLRDARSGREQVLLHVLLAKLYEAQQDAKADEIYKEAQQRAMQIADGEERKNTEAVVGVAVIEYQERQRQLREMIETARWVLDRLGPEHADARQIQRKLIEALLILAQEKSTADRLDDIERQLKIAGGIKPDDAKKLQSTPLVSLFPKFDGALLSSAAKLALLRDDEATLSEALREILKQDDRNVWALMTRGMVALNRGRYDDARQDLEKAAQFTTPRSDWAYTLRTVLAQLYENTNMLDKAIEQLRMKLDLLVDATNPPPDVEEREQEVTANIVRLYERQNRLDDAQALISAYLERFPNAARWPLRLGRMLDTRGDDARRARSARDAERFYRAAEQRYRDAAEKGLAEWQQGTTPRAQTIAAIAMSQAVAARMDVLVKLGDAPAALRCFAEPPLGGTALAQQPPPTLRLAKGRALWAAGQQAEARQEWKLTLNETANQPEHIAAPGLATVVARLNEVLTAAELEALLREAAAEKPLETDAGRRLRLALADFLMQTLAVGGEAVNQERAAEVVELTKTVAAQVPPGGVTYLWALVTRAQASERAGDDATAISTYQEALSADPNNTLALNNLAYLLVSTADPKLQRPQEAAAYADQLDRLIRSDANLPNLLDTMGWVYFQYVQMGDAGRFPLDPGDRQRRLDGAVAKLERALTLSGDRIPAIFEHVGKLYAFQGRNHEARQKYTQGLEAARRANDEATAARLRSLLAGG